MAVKVHWVTLGSICRYRQNKVGLNALIATANMSTKARLTRPHSLNATCQNLRKQRSLRGSQMRLRVMSFGHFQMWHTVELDQQGLVQQHLPAMHGRVHDGQTHFGPSAHIQ